MKKSVFIVKQAFYYVYLQYSLCNSFDSDIYPDIYDRKNAVKKETKYLSNFLDGNNAEMLSFVGEKLKELDEKSGVQRIKDE